jgi:hypothetical protein
MQFKGSPYATPHFGWFLTVACMLLIAAFAALKLFAPLSILLAACCIALTRLRARRMSFGTTEFHSDSRFNVGYENVPSLGPRVSLLI